MNPADHTHAPWQPCRPHLFDALTAVAGQNRHRARWRMPQDVWLRITADPNLNGDWTLDTDRGKGGLSRTLLGLPVTIADDGPARVQIVLDVACRPGRE